MGGYVQSLFLITATSVSIYYFLSAFQDTSLYHYHRHQDVTGDPVPDHEENANLEAAHPAGHMKPFGESGSQSQISVVAGYPSKFLKDYLFASKPLLLKGAAKLSPAFGKWTDQYLRQVATSSGNDDVQVETETGKKEDRDGGTRQMSLAKFLDVYNTSDLYLVDNVPTYLDSDLMMPCPLQCPNLELVPLTKIMWFSSGGTKSVVHYDNSDNINCLFRGSKTIVFIDPSEFSIGSIVDRPNGAYSKMDVDKVDMYRYQTLRGIRFWIADMEPGDCLYIPYMWIHQVRSFNSNLAVNFWIDHYETLELLKSNHCMDHDLDCDLTSTLDLWRNPMERVSSERPPSELQLEKDFLSVLFDYGAYHLDDLFDPITKPSVREKVKIDSFVNIIKTQFLPNLQETSKYFVSDINAKLHRVLQTADAENDGILSKSEFEENIQAIYDGIYECVIAFDKIHDDHTAIVDDAGPNINNDDYSKMDDNKDALYNSLSNSESKDNEEPRERDEL